MRRQLLTRAEKAVWTLSLCLLVALPNETLQGRPPGPLQASKDLLVAVVANDLDRVKAALTAGAALDARDARGRTPLVLAASLNPKRSPSQSRNASDDEPDRRRSQNAVLLELLTAAATRSHSGWVGDGMIEGHGTVGGSFVAWLESDGSIRVFGKSGGLLLNIRGRIPKPPAAIDVDGDGRNEFVADVVGTGTGLYVNYHEIYFFDDRRFAPPLRVMTYGDTDSTWFGHLRRGEELFLIPPLGQDGELRFHDTDGDGVADVAEAVERRWWGSRDNEAAPDKRRTFAEGPRWASEMLRRRDGLPLGRVQTRVVNRWRRDPVAKVFVRQE